MAGYKENFVAAVEDDVKCSVCNLPLQEPVQTRCGHRFCRECLEEATRRYVMHRELEMIFFFAISVKPL